MAIFPTQSASLNGTTQGFSAGDNASLSPTGDMTCEVWVKLNSEPGSGVEYDIMSKHDNGGGANGRSFTMTYLNNAGTLQFTIRISSDGTSANQSVGTLNHTFGTGIWYHIAFVYTAAAGTVQIFKNGISLGTITGQKTSIFDSTTALTIGIRGDLTSSSLNGRIGMARLWKGTARTGSQISSAMFINYGSAQTNLSGEWSLDNVLTDTSGNSNTLTNVGTATFSADVTVFFPTITNSGVATGVSAGTSRTVAATVTAGNNNNVGVVFLWNITGNSFGAVTWNGASMTSGAVNTPAFSFRSQMYYISAPTTGNIVVNWTGADTSVGVAWCVIKDAVQGAPDIEGYVGVNQVATVTKSVTTTVNNDLMLAGFAIQPTSSARVEGTGQLNVVVGTDNMGATNYYAEMSTKVGFTAGSNAMALSWTTNRDADALVVAIKYKGSAVNSGFFMAATQ